MTLLRPQRRPWLWLLLAVWLVAVQGFALEHADKHSLTRDQNNCQLCNFAGHNDIGFSFSLTVRSPAPILVAARQLPYTKPQLNPSRRMPVRGPPALF